MSADDDNVEIEIDEIEKTEDTDDIVVEDADNSEPEVKNDIDKSLEDLKAQLDRERQARLDAERRAHETESSLYQAKNETKSSNLHLVTNAIETVKQTNDVLKANYREAMAVGDYDAAADIQATMVENAAKLQQLEQGRKALEKTPDYEVPEPYMPSDPVEALASQLSPRSAAWVRSHPEYATDTKLYQKMLAAHNLAVTDDIEPDSDEYFEAIETTLRIRNAPRAYDEDASSQAAKPTQRRSSPPAAPVSRGGSGTGSRGNVVRLSAEEREMASLMGMTDKEYAQNKIELKKSGRMN